MGGAQWPTPHTPKKGNMDTYEKIMIGRKISFEVSTEENDWDRKFTKRVQAKVRESQNGIIMATDIDEPDHLYTLTYDPKFVTLEA